MYSGRQSRKTITGCSGSVNPAVHGTRNTDNAAPSAEGGPGIVLWPLGRGKPSKDLEIQLSEVSRQRLLAGLPGSEGCRARTRTGRAGPRSQRHHGTYLGEHHESVEVRMQDISVSQPAGPLGRSCLGQGLGQLWTLICFLSSKRG